MRRKWLIQSLARSRKYISVYYVGTVNGTDIYYLTWSLENVSKSCQFQFFRPPPPKQTLTIFWGV